MFIFERTKEGVFQMESWEPGMIYNAETGLRIVHYFGDLTELLKQPNADSAMSTSQSSECSPEA